jgi:FkbM family methyltransferase
MKNPVNLLKPFAPRAMRQRLKHQLEDYFDVPTAERSLQKMHRLGFRPSCAVDIGAYRGEWTVLAREIFPDASFLMLEAQDKQEPVLSAVKQQLGLGVDYRIALLGPENRDNVIFQELTSAPTGSSMLSYRPTGETRQVKRRMQTLDTILTETGIAKADLVKLDVQGYELEVLKGARNFLKYGSVIMMEVSVIELYENNPLLQEVLAFMLQNSFVPYDISGIMRRPGDGILAQIDMAFVSMKSLLYKQQQQANPSEANTSA